ncbi:uncharacterized protein MONBRDRAFT_33369 [Monosiga brevicollis MX1]|uniref:Oxysterol-binding protein n=1 Tax=Monosiga brevicollis TaxID=81824 RepID=A9V513_MONBE|nr:uncharacterized protein MONBRDRAFT_33369 [Monosiga brevicollis MX1]EDQ87298.1 predicted protein [Monosiga brevicollis MX1]|eukprot:XP_001747911.1 hypothetical protein [Monosiga brevicollis MX1]
MARHPSLWLPAPRPPPVLSCAVSGAVSWYALLMKAQVSLLVAVLDDEQDDELDESIGIEAKAGALDLAEDEPVGESLRWAADNDYERRSHLSVKHDHALQSNSLWGVLKKNIGKKLSHIAMPVTFNEPLSALQRLCEELEHSHLLDNAAAAADPRERLMWVGAFAVASYGSSHFRSGRKPFNPILGETFDEVRPERGFRFFAEQVSHHPPISVCVAESSLWTFYQEAGVKSSLRPSSLKVTPQGFIRVSFPAYDETYEWQKVVTHVEDIVSGNKWVDHHGRMCVVNCRTGDTCKVELFQYSRFKKSQKYAVKGTVIDVANPKKPFATFSGKWNEKLVRDDTQEELWTNPVPEQESIDHEFGFTKFAMELNELPPEGNGQRDLLLATDSRNRPDQRLWEEAKEEAAAEEKLRVEELQRVRRQELEAEGKQHEPRFFEYRRVPAPKPAQLPSGVPALSREAERAEWLYKGGFWRQKKEQSIKSLPPLW